MELKVGDKKIDSLHNDKSYKYLGVMINLNLNWKDQHNVTEEQYKNLSHY